MKRLLACAALALLPGMAVADWTSNGAELFLNSSDGRAILVMDNKKIAFFIPNTSDCKQEKEALPLKVNNKYVMSEKYCKNDGAIFFIKYFYDALFVTKEALSYKNIEVNGLQDTATFFENKGLSEADQKIPPDTKIEKGPSGEEVIYKRIDSNPPNNLFFNDSDVVTYPR